MIDAYLDELHDRLRGLPQRRRFVAEAEAHLRALADEHGEEEAVRRFGSAELVAARIAPELASRASARASRLLLVTTLLYVVPFYAIPENTFPPATWAVIPPEIAWKHDGALRAFAVAVVAAALATAIRGRARAALLTVGVAALLTSLVLSAWMDAEWPEYVAGTPTAIVWGVMVPLKLLLAGAATAAWATSMSATLRTQARSE